MHDTTLEKLVWVLIYGGLLTLSLGAFVRRQSDVWGSSLLLAGAVAVLAGVALIVVRARRNPPD